jgi:DNA-binding NarL/FixJ family response regulator
MKAIINELQKLNVKAKIEATGCIGYCAREVIVDIKLPGENGLELTRKIKGKYL